MLAGLLHQAFQLPELRWGEFGEDLTEVFAMLSIDRADESPSALGEGDQTDSAIFRVARF